MNYAISIGKAIAYIDGSQGAWMLQEFLEGLMNTGCDLSNITVFSPYSKSYTKYRVEELNGIKELTSHSSKLNT